MSTSPHSEYAVTTTSSTTPSTPTSSGSTLSASSPSPISVDSAAELRASVESYLMQASSTVNAADATTDLLSALLFALQHQDDQHNVVLQEQHNNANSRVARQFPSSSLSATPVLASYDELSGAMPKTEATTTASSSPAPSVKYGSLQLEDSKENRSCSNTSCFGAYNFHSESPVPRQPLPRSPTTTATMTPTAAMLAPSTLNSQTQQQKQQQQQVSESTPYPSRLLDNDSAAHPHHPWPGFADLFSNLLTTSSDVSPTHASVSSALSPSLFDTTSSPSHSTNRFLSLNAAHSGHSVPLSSSRAVSTPTPRESQQTGKFPFMLPSFLMPSSHTPNGSSYGTPSPRMDPFNKSVFLTPMVTECGGFSSFPTSSRQSRNSGDQNDINDKHLLEGLPNVGKSGEEETVYNSGTAASQVQQSSLLFHPDGSLNLDFFKVLECKNESHVHDRKSCPFYHSHRDRRRQPVTYNAEQCDDHFDVEGDVACFCENGDNCDKCHNRHELLYHPGIYKQRFCSSYNHLECHRGRFCAFAHTRAEIRCDLFTEEEERNPKSEFFMKSFKTLWCPYGVQHDWHGCLYAHTYQDCRRSPNIVYGSEPCPYWQKDLHSADYQKRCPFGPRCPYSHGSKEQLYHPAYYKTMPCADYKTKRNCPRSNLCAFYHDLSEKRPPIVTSATGGAGGDSEGIKLYDYTRAIPSALMNLLQPNFMRPPLFNLDDFEAFGHACRVGSGCREPRGSGQNTPHSSNSRSGPFPSNSPYPNSPGYPSMHHPQYPPTSFFRPGVSTPHTSPNRNGAVYPPYAAYPMHNRSGSGSPMPHSYGQGSCTNGNNQHHSIYSPLSQPHQRQPLLGLNHHPQQPIRNTFINNNNNNTHSQTPPAVYDERFAYSDSFSGQRRTTVRHQLQRFPHHSPIIHHPSISSQMSLPRSMRYINHHKEEHNHNIMSVMND